VPRKSTVAPSLYRAYNLLPLYHFLHPSAAALKTVRGDAKDARVAHARAEEDKRRLIDQVGAITLVLISHFFNQPSLLLIITFDLSFRFFLSIHPFDSSFRFILSIHLFDSSFQFILSIHPFDSSLRFILSIHPFDSSFRFILSIHPFDSSFRFILSISGGSFEGGEWRLE
jgi:hypothetical protein